MKNRFLAVLGAALAAAAFALPPAVVAQQKAEPPKEAKPAAAKPEPRRADAAKGSDARGGRTTVLVDINTASPKELAALPGIGEARAQAIVKNRPYRGKDDLRDRKIIPESVYKGIQDRIIAKQK